jgi:hypothetical protein
MIRTNLDKRGRWPSCLAAGKLGVYPKAFAARRATRHPYFLLQKIDAVMFGLAK